MFPAAHLGRGLYDAWLTLSTLFSGAASRPPRGNTTDVDNT